MDVDKHQPSFFVEGNNIENFWALGDVAKIAHDVLGGSSTLVPYVVRREAMHMHKKNV